MKILFIFLLIGALTLNAFSLPLIFKTSKQVKADGEILTFDASKYKSLRIGVYLVGGEPNKESRIIITAAEDLDDYFIDTFTVNTGFRSRSISVESPPAKIRILCDTPGTYKVSVWAE